MTYDGPERRGGRMRRALSEFGHDPPPSSTWHHVWRDVVPLIALIIALFAVKGMESKVDRATFDAKIARSTATSQTEGRRIAIAVLCGFGNGVEQAGKASISMPVLPAKFRRNLEKLGLPTARVRAPGAKKAGEAYARAISKSVVEQAGVDAKAVIKPDGSMNCPALQSVAHTTPMP